MLPKEIEHKIESRIAEFLRLADASNQRNMVVSVVFYDKKSKKSWFAKEDDDCWEEWF
jgi:hypothetical protein